MDKKLLVQNQKQNKKNKTKKKTKKKKQGEKLTTFYYSTYNHGTSNHEMNFEKIILIVTIQVIDMYMSSIISVNQL